MIKTLVQLRTENRSFFATLFQHKSLDRLLTRPNGEKVLVRCKWKAIDFSWRTRWEIYKIGSNGTVGHLYTKNFETLKDLKKYLKGER